MAWLMSARAMRDEISSSTIRGLQDGACHFFPGGVDDDLNARPLRHPVLLFIPRRA